MMKPVRTATTVAASIAFMFLAACAGNATEEGGTTLQTGTGGSPGGATGGSTSGSTGGSTTGSSGTGTHSSSGGTTTGSSGSGSDAGSSGGSSGSTDAGGGDPIAAGRALCLQIINMDRATLNSPPLTEATPDQETCVDGQAKADFTANTPHSAFGQCKEHAQNECPDWPGPPSAIMTKCLADMWAEGPPPAGQDNHWLNMSNAKYTKVACGFYQTPNGHWWATQDFW
jgi:hypothetical protein